MDCESTYDELAKEDEEAENDDPFSLITRRHRIQSSAMQAFMNSVRAEHALGK